MTDRFPHTICVQFKAADPDRFPLGTSDELAFRHEREKDFESLLAKHRLGICDGGQIGGGSMETFLYVADIPKAVQIITKYLTDNEWISFSKVASVTAPLTIDSKWVLHYPATGEFSPMEWL